MNNKITLVIGGARSGKSTFAEQLVRNAGGRRFYIATAPVFDQEMAERVIRHQEARKSDHWITIEEEIHLTDALTRAAAQGAEAILVDCLTLWINNLLFRNEKLSEDDFWFICQELLERLKQTPAHIVLVINEVGLGLVPENPLARRFRDLSGRCAQSIASGADEVYYIIAGISRRIK